MYNVKGPSNIVAKTRRGLSQNIDREVSKGRGISENNNSEYNIVPKPVFHSVPKKGQGGHQGGHDEPSLTPQHAEMIKYINESWNCIYSELDSNSSDGSASPISDQASVLYFEDEPTLALTDFKPFDLESWWVKRLFAYCTTPSDDS